MRQLKYLRRAVVANRYKLRVYKLRGSDTGDLDHEEFFETVFQMNQRYYQLFKREHYSLNPTGWELKDDAWVRLEGY